MLILSEGCANCHFLGGGGFGERAMCALLLFSSSQHYKTRGSFYEIGEGEKIYICGIHWFTF